MKKMKNLIKLDADMGYNKVGDMGYIELIDNLRNLQKLEKVNLVLNDNEIKKEGYDDNLDNLR